MEKETISSGKSSCNSLTTVVREKYGGGEGVKKIAEDSAYQVFKFSLEVGVHCFCVEVLF